MAFNEAVAGVDAKADAPAGDGPPGGRPIDRIPGDSSYLCEREPIHLPGAIQPHGALLAVLEGSRAITHASANLFEILGHHAIDLLGKPLDTAIDEKACVALLRPVSSEQRLARAHVVTGPTGKKVYLHAHRTGPYICIDIEPMRPDGDRTLPTLGAQSLMDSFQHASDCATLCELAVRGLKDVTGYDRVMAYRFSEKGHGEVIAEALEPHLAPYLGLRYPASDIPAQARRQYVRQRVGAIADSSYEPVPLLVDPSLRQVVPIDLTHSGLRSVSPVHCEYMRNMQTAASLTIGLAQEGRLWGMLVCHHERPRIAGPEVRAAAGMIGEVVSALLANREAAELRAQRSSRKAILAELTRHLSSALPLPDAFAAAETALLGLVDATGAVIEIGGTRFCVGRTPPLPATEIALEGLRIIAASNLVAIDEVALRFPELEACRAEGSGARFLPLEPGGDDAILWFRPELSRTVLWGGDPTRHVTVDPASGRLSPRTSFASWQQALGGHSSPWSQADCAMALELRDTIRAEVARRTRAALRESEERFQLLAEHSGVVVTLNDMEGVRRYVSPAARQLLGWHPADLVGRNALDFIHPDDAPLIIATRAALLTGDVQPACYRFRRPDGTWVWVEGHGRLRHVDEDGAPTEYVVVLRDATERKAVEARLTDALGRLERVASIDGLTGIANRRHFDEVVDREWRRCGRERLPLSLLLLDADHFKRFNDCYGHLAGDACLQAIAGQIESMAQRPGDLAARYGGEEFLLLLPNTGVEGATRVAERVRALIEGLGVPHEANDDGKVVTVSVGVATAWPGEADTTSHDIGMLLARTDAALYRAKSEGRNRFVVSPVDESVDGDQAGTPARGDASRADAAPSETSHARDIAATHEALVQFLYRAPIGLVQTTLDGTIEMINPMSASLLMPISQDGDLDNLFVALEAVAPDLRERVQHFEAENGTVCEGVRIPLPVGATLGTATQILSISLSKLDATRLMAMVGDVTVEVQREQSGLALSLDAAARTDNLTQLPNRTVVCDLIEAAIARRHTDPCRDFAVLFMNCDRFKQINDTLGYAAGDAVLGLMADRLQSTLRQLNRGDAAMVGRLGGDEFAVLLDDLCSPEEMHSIAKRLLHVLSQPYHVQSRQLHFSVSMGVVLGAQATADAPTVLQDSSIAMVEAKRAGGARYVLFEAAMHERALHRGRIESELRRALLEQQLFVVYQPVVGLQTATPASSLPARSAGVEALVRWRHPTRGVVPPTEFIGVAEESGLIGAVGEFVLATACRQFVEWQSTLGAFAPGLLAVNLSRGQLIEGGFVEFVAQVLRTTGMPPGQLQLEVTESLAAQDESIRARLHELKALGLTLALDDFGTGYSSLASLHELPVDTVKIDRSFVSEATTSTYHRVLIEATIRVASSLDMATVAEGIETDEQAALLRELRCGKGQGYLFSKPLAADDLADWLRKAPDDTGPVAASRPMSPST